MRNFQLAVFCMVVAALVACGGGGGGADSGVQTTGSSGGGGGSGSGGSGFYLPYVATSTAGGETGVFVVPSNNLSATPVFVTRTPAASQGVSVISLLKQSSAPYAFVYIASGSDGNAHVYLSNISNTSVVPSATQLSSLSLRSMADICGIVGWAQANVDDPTTWFVVLHINAGGTSSCGAGGDVYQVIHYNDSSTTDPTVANITAPTTPLGSALTALYQSNGALGGLVLLDSATGNLDFYSDDTFTSPKVLTTGVSASHDMIDDSAFDNTDSVGATTAFLSVTTTSGTSVWRVPASGAASKVYTASGNLSPLGVADASNVYFSDNAVPGGQAIYQEPIAGGTPTPLYRSAMSGLTLPPAYMLVGSNGTSLVLTANGGSATGGISTSVVTLPVSTPSAPTTIAGPFAGVATVSMCPSTFGDATSDVILVTQGTPGSAPVSYSSEALTPGGVVKQPALANSAFLAPPGSGGFGSVLQVRGITDTSGGYGGGTVSALNLSSFSTTTLNTTTGSGTYTVPSGDQLFVTFLSADIGLGVVGPQPNSTSSGGSIAVDLSKSLIVTVSVPNSTVSVLL